jgi:hypothetical protein
MKGQPGEMVSFDLTLLNIAGWLPGECKKANKMQ